MTRATTILCLLLACALLPPNISATEEATPSGTPAAAPHNIGTAERNFRASGTRLLGTSLFRFGVAAYRTPEDARAAEPAARQWVEDNPDLSGLRPASAPAVADGAVAYAGEVPGNDEGALVDAAYLVIRDGRYIHLWAGAGLVADPLPELLAIAERVIEQDDSGPPNLAATPAPNDLLDLLPGLRDLPPGFVLDSEEVDGTPTP